MVKGMRKWVGVEGKGYEKVGRGRGYGNEKVGRGMRYGTVGRGMR